MFSLFSASHVWPGFGQPLGFRPGENMYAGEAYIGNHRTGNNAVSNTITKHLGYGIGDYDLIRTVRVWSPGYILDDDGNYPEGMF